MSKKTPIKEFWAEYLTYDAQKGSNATRTGQLQSPKEFR